MDLKFEIIPQPEAKAIMDSGVDYVLLDVRTDEEFKERHIPGAILIPDYDIAKECEKQLPDKNRLILIYCRRGRRSKLAAAIMGDLGYTNLKEFGGINDWQYEIIYGEKDE